MTLWTRCLIGTIGFASFTTAMKYIPLSMFFVIFNSNPFTTALLGFFWLKEKLTCFEITAMFCAFLGIVIMSLSHPSNYEDIAEQNSIRIFSTKEYQYGLLLAGISCVGQSFICVASRKLWSIHFSVIQFSYALCSTICMGLCVLCMPKPANHRPFVYDSLLIYLEIGIASVFNNIAQNLFTYTNQNACPATVGLIAYSGVLYNFLVDVAIFNL